MPANPCTPNSSSAVDRLALSVDSPRGTEPANQSGVWLMGGGGTLCFETAPAGMCPWFAYCSCFEAETSAIFGTENVGLCAVSE